MGRVQHLLLDHGEHRVAAPVDLPALIVRQIREEALHAAFEKLLGLLPARSEVDGSAVELFDFRGECLERLTHLEKAHFLAELGALDHVIDEVDEAAHISSRPRPHLCPGRVEALGHLLGADLAEVVHKTLFDGQVVDLLQLARRDFAIGRQPHIQQADLGILALGELDDATQEPRVFQQAPDRRRAVVCRVVGDVVFVPDQVPHDLVVLGVDLFQALEDLEIIHGLGGGIADLLLQGIPPLAVEDVVAHDLGLGNLDGLLLHLVIDLAQGPDLVGLGLGEQSLIDIGGKVAGHAFEFARFEDHPAALLLLQPAVCFFPVDLSGIDHGLNLRLEGRGGVLLRRYDRGRFGSGSQRWRYWVPGHGRGCSRDAAGEGGALLLFQDLDGVLHAGEDIDLLPAHAHDFEQVADTALPVKPANRGNPLGLNFGLVPLERAHPGGKGAVHAVLHPPGHVGLRVGRIDRAHYLAQAMLDFGGGCRAGQVPVLRGHGLLKILIRNEHLTLLEALQNSGPQLEAQIAR